MNSNITTALEPTILIVDDNLDNLKLLSDMLRKSGYKTRRAINGSLALQALSATKFDLILLDITMPDIDGYTVCKKIKSHDRFKDIPVIFISALNDVIDKVKAFEVGGIDYIPKPFQIEEVTARVENQMRIVKLQNKLKFLNLQLQQKNSKLQLEHKSIKQSQARIVHNSLKDPLTNFNTKIAFMGQIRQVLKQSADKEKYNFALLIIQYEQFKISKSIISEQVFKNCAIAISKNIVEALPSSSIFGRLDDTEFGVLIENISQAELQNKIVEEIRPKLSLSLSFAEKTIFLNPNYGIVMGQKNYTKPEQLLYGAKNAVTNSLIDGYGNYCFLDRSIEEKTLKNLQLKTQFKTALDKKKFKIQYQPIINLKTSKISALNTRIYLNCDREESVEIEELAQIAFDIGFIRQFNNLFWQNIGDRVKKLQEAFLWQDGLEENFARNFQVKIKVATVQFFQLDFVEQIKSSIKKFNLECETINLELSNLVLQKDCELAIDKINELRELGIKTSLNCVNICSLQLIRDRKLSVDNLTITPELLSNIVTEDRNRAIYSNLIELAHNLDLTLTATGVSNSKQLEVLIDRGCDFARGEYISELVKTPMELIK